MEVAMKRLVLLSVIALAVPALGYAQNASPALQAAQPGAGADPAIQPAARQGLPSEEPTTAAPARDPSSAGNPSIDPDPEASARMHGSRLAAALPAGMSASEACSGFKSEMQCATALHAAQNLDIPFADLKSRLNNGEKLDAVIRTLKPASDARGEVRRAQEQAHSDLSGHSAG
jgi:hypothetical protein